MGGVVSSSDESDEAIVARFKSFQEAQPERARKILAKLNEEQSSSPPSQLSEAEGGRHTSRQLTMSLLPPQGREGAYASPASATATATAQSADDEKYFKEQLEPTLRPLVENIVQDRPENIHRYLSQRLLNRNIDLGREATLRIIAVNDVYVLDNFPALNTLIKANSTPNIITVLAGDFVAPSLLSSLDSGYGMVDCMNLCPISHVCFGNHEADIDHQELLERMKQFNGVWLNTNMQDFGRTAPGVEHAQLPEYDIITVANGEHTRKVGLLGVLSNDPALYRPGAFGGALIDDVDAKLAEWYERLTGPEFGCDLVIPITHQYIPEDTRTCASMRDRGPMGSPAFPVMIGGHDHDVFSDEIDGCWVLKAGSDAKHAMIIDISWADERPETRPTISYELQAVTAYRPAPLLSRAVTKHHTLVRALELANLCDLCDMAEELGGPMTSRDMRVRPTTIGTMICSTLRHALHADAVLINAGGIRGDSEYPPEHKYFTFGDLKRELPFESEVVVVQIPGQVIKDMVAFSRKHAPLAKSMFLQLDDACGVADDGVTLVTIHGRPIKPEREYSVGLLFTSLTGMDNIEPLLAWGECNREKVPPEDSGIPVKVLLVKYYSKQIFSRIFELLREDSELAHDDVITKDELVSAMQRLGYESGDGTLLMANHIMDTIDADQNGTIEWSEIQRALGDLESPRTPAATPKSTVPSRGAFEPGDG